MRKLLVLGVLAVAATAFSQDQASAWVNAKFGVGLNLGWQSGGNNFLWGAYRGGQPGGQDFIYGHGCQSGNCQGYYNGYPGYQMGMPYSAPAAVPTMIPAAPAQGATKTSDSQFWYNYPVYQSVNFDPYFTSYGFFMP